MSWRKRLVQWLNGTSANSPRLQAKPTLRELIDKGRHARFAEQYSQALDYFDQAEALARPHHDTTAFAIIMLNRIDILIQQMNYQEAAEKLTYLRDNSQDVGQQTPLAYALCSLGVLAQEQGNWQEAQSYYEQALTIAEEAGAKGALGRAKAHLADIYLHDENTNYASYLLKEAIVLLDESGDTELLSYFVGRYGQAMIALGQTSDGDALIHNALRRSKTMNHQRYIRHWHLEVAKRHQDKQELWQAYDHYQKALEAYPNPRPQHADIISQLLATSQLATQLKLTDDALSYAQQAQAITKHIDLRNTQRAELTYTMGLAYVGQQADETAKSYFEQALEMVDEDSTIFVPTLHQLANLNARQSNIQLAIEQLQHSIDIASDSESIQLYCDLGHLYRQQNDLNNALATWERSKTLDKTQENRILSARVHSDIAEAHWEQGQGKQALQEIEQALVHLGYLEDKATRGLVLANTANIYAHGSDSATTESFFKEAIDIAEAENDTQAQSIRLNNYGWYLLATGRPMLAITQYEQALNLSRAQNWQHEMAIQTTNLGNAYTDLDQFDMALQYHQDALVMANAVDDPIISNRVRINVAKTLIQMGQWEKARTTLDEIQATLKAYPHFEQALDKQLIQMELHLHDDEAKSVLESLMTLQYDAKQGGRQRHYAQVLDCKHRALLQMGQKDQARETLEEAKKQFEILDMPYDAPLQSATEAQA